MTIGHEEGMFDMTDQAKFEGFKKQMIDDNEKKYSNEARAKYGEEVFDESIKTVMGWSREDHEKTEAIGRKINEKLKKAFEVGDPNSELAQEVCALHKEWIMCYWNKYSKEAHLGLVRMYLDDSRFKAYYDKIALGCASLKMQWKDTLSKRRTAELSF